MIKINFYGLCILLFVSFKALADKPRVKGYYVDNNSDTIRVMIEIPLEIFNKKVAINMLQYSFTYFDKKGKEFKMKDVDAQAFGFVYMKEVFTFQLVKEITMPVVGNMHPIGTFLRLLEKGNCNLYIVKTVSNGSPSTEYVFKRGENDVYLTDGRMFNGKANKKLAEYFSDCPQLGQKITNKEFNDSDTRHEEIARYYNKSCASNSSASEGE